MQVLNTENYLLWEDGTLVWLFIFVEVRQAGGRFKLIISSVTVISLVWTVAAEILGYRICSLAIATPADIPFV